MISFFGLNQHEDDPVSCYRALVGISRKIPRPRVNFKKFFRLYHNRLKLGKPISGQCRPTVCNTDPPSAMPVAWNLCHNASGYGGKCLFLQKTQDRQCHGWANVGEAS